MLRARVGRRPTQTAGRRRRADRAEAIGRMGDRQHAGRDRRRSATARARRCPLQVPGIARGAIEPGLAGEAEPELAAARLAVDHHAGTLEPADMEAVPGRRRQVGEEAAAARGPGAGERRAQILQQERHAGERPLRQACLDGLRGVVVELHHDRVDGRVARIDTRDRRLQHLRRADLARLHQRRETKRIARLVLREAAHRSSPSPSRPVQGAGCRL